MKKVLIDPAIFEKYSDFTRGIVIVKNIENREEDPAIRELLDKEIELKKGQELVGHEFVKAWDSVYENFGANPNKFPPSIKSLLKRISKGGSLPFINSVVALFNYISIKHLVPCGGDDINRIEGNLKLALALGEENFTPLGGSENEHPEPGEVIYFDDKTLNVMCRRWNWRNADFSKITPQTKSMVINVDGIGPASRSLIEGARDELAKLLTDHCQAELTTSFLDKDTTEANID